MINFIIADTKKLNFTIKYKESTQPVDLSAATVKVMIKKLLTDADDDAIIIKEFINPSSNIILCEFSSDDTKLLIENPFNYHIALKIFFDSGVEYTAFQDILIPIKGVFDE